MFNIPEEKLPECLRDDQRVNVLFAPLRSRSVNSKDWDNKVSSWKQIITTYCETNDVYSFTLSSLNNIFVRNGRPPYCLVEVIQDMVKNGEVQTYEVFVKRKSETWSGWATDILVRRPFSWSMNKINSVLSTKDQDPHYVHLETVKIKCQSLMDSIPEKSKNKLVSLKELVKILNRDIKIDSVKLLLCHLTNNDKAYVTNIQGKDELETFLIKFSDGSKSMGISDADIAIYTLERNESMILKGMEDLEDDIEKCVEEAKMHLSKKHRQLAKSALRKKHELEKRLDKKSKALHNVQHLLEQILETHADAHVWESYKKALSAFETAFKDTGLSEDAVDDTMIRLGEMLDKHDDIQEALARPAQDITVDETSLEQELEDLLKSDINNPPPDGGLNISDIDKEFDKLALNLPDVPSGSPNSSRLDGELTSNSVL